MRMKSKYSSGHFSIKVIHGVTSAGLIFFMKSYSAEHRIDSDVVSINFIKCVRDECVIL